MSKAFNLTAQLNLTGPNNLKPIVSKIQKEIGSIKADVKFNLDPKAAKSIDNVKNKLMAMNSVLANAKNNANELNATLRSLSAGLSSVKSSGGQAGASMAAVAKNAASTAKNLKVASSQMEEFGKQSYLAIKRFAAFGIAAGGIYRLINAVTTGFKAFIDFDRELVRLQQVTGDGSVAIQGLSKQITGLATSLGVSSEKLTEVAVTLAQAGLSAKETEQALAALAKTELAPSFDNLTDTTEGAIAAMRQFGIATKDLEAALGSINAVAAGFAVESSDIITAIQRAGGAFAASSTGVSEGTDALNEFIAVFTSVRATTRESAETIATGLRTIFTRIQRPQTIEFLKQFGVELTDIEGKFVGPYEAVKRLNSVLSKMDPRELKFGQIVEELGGFRQISKVIPLIQQFAEAEKALKTAQQGQGSLTKAQEVAQQSLAVQLAKVREEFLALIKTVGQSDTFQGFFKVVLGLSSALIKLAGAFRPLLPALAILGSIKGGKAITEFAGGFFGSFKKGGGSKAFGTSLGSRLTGEPEKDRKEATNKAAEGLRENTTALSVLTKSIEQLTTTINNKGGSSTLNSGGRVLGFARGGSVPGTGNSDTVPAMLQPGEFVLRKKAVEKLGTGNLHSINKYAGGGKALGARSKVKELDESELAQLSTADLIAYAKKQAHDIFSTGGAGMAVRSEFIEVPPERIIPELDSDLTTYMGKRGFWKEIVAPFGKGKTLSAKQASKLGREDALKAQMSRQADEVAAREQQWTSISSGSAIDNYLLSQLKDPILIDYKTVRGGGSLPKAFHNTRLRKAVNEALESYDDFDYSGANLDKLISNFAAKKFAAGGTVEEQIKQNMKSGDNLYQFGIAALKSGTSKGDRYETFKLSDKDPESPTIGLHIGTLGGALKNNELANDIENNLTKQLQRSIVSTAEKIGNPLGIKDLVKDNKQAILDGTALSSAVGNIYEGALNMLGAPFVNKSEKTKSIDFPFGLGALAGKFFGDEKLANIPTDATRTFGGSGKNISDFKSQIGRFFKAVQNNEFTKAQEKLNKQLDTSTETDLKKYLPSTNFKEFIIDLLGQESAAKIGRLTLKRQDSFIKKFPTLEQKDRDSVEKYIQQQKTAEVGNSKHFGGIIARFAKGGSAQDTVPALLTPGEFVINKKAAQRIGYGKLNRMNKADKIQGFNKGGSVGGIQKFATGGSVDDPRIVAALEDAAKRAGVALSAFEKQLREEIATKALAISKDKKETRANITTNIVKAAAKGLGNRESRKEFATSLSGKIKSLNPSAKDSDVNKAVGEIIKGIKSGKTFDEMLKSATASLKPLNDALDSTKDNMESLREAQDILASEFGGLTSAVQVSIEQLNAIDYQRSGQASKDFGILGDLAPQIALGFKQSGVGAGLLSSANKFQNFGIKGLDETLAKLPGPLGDAVKAIGGLPGVLAGAGSILADTLKNNDVFGKSVTGAGLVGALGGAGSSAISLGTLGQQLAGPIGGMIGTIGGALSGAIDGFLESSKIKELENSMFGLNEGIDKANKALDNLSKIDNSANYKTALKSVDSLRDNINDLGTQAQSTFGEKATTGAAGAIVGGTIGTAAGFGALALSSSAAAATAAGGATAAAATASGLTAVGGAIAGLASVVGTGGVILIPALLAGIGYGLYRFSQGTKDLDKQALEGQLKAIENYVKGLSQLTERKVRLSSLADIESSIKAYENAKTPEQKQALGANSAILQEAAQGAEARGVSVETAKRDAAVALAMQELNQIYAGNTEVIKKESANKEKLIKRGLELAAEQSHQIALQERMTIAMKQVSMQIESLIELFDQISGVIERFNSEMDSSQTKLNELTDLMMGEGKVGSVSRRDEDILKNAGAYSEAEFNKVLEKISELSGGGANATKLTEGLKGKKIIETQLPDLLRGTTKNDIQEVERKLEELFKQAGISGEAKTSIIDEIVGKLNEETQGRQGKSFKELAQEFDVLQKAMDTYNGAFEASSTLLKANNDQSERYAQNLNKINQGIQRNFDLISKADEIRLESALKLDEILGAKSSETNVAAKDKEIRRLAEAGGAGATLDVSAIDRQFKQVIEEFGKNQQDLMSDPGNKDLLEKERKLANQANNLDKALKTLSERSDKASKIMDEFSRSQNLKNNVQDILKQIYTANAEETINLREQMALGSEFIKNPSIIKDLDVEGRKNALAGLDMFKQLGLVNAQEEGNIFLQSLPEEMRKLVIAKMDEKGKTFEDLFKTDTQKFTEAIKQDEQERLKAIAALQAANDEFINKYETANNGLIKALQDVSTTIANKNSTPQATVSTRTNNIDNIEEEQQRLLQEYLKHYQQKSSTPVGTPAIPATTSKVDSTNAPGTNGSITTTRLFELDEKTKTFLTEFKDSMNNFGSYLDKMGNIAEKLAQFPTRIEMQGRHTVQVSITGDKVWATLEGKMLTLIQGEIDKKMNAVWNKTGGEMGSSGAGGSRVAARFDTQQM